MLTPHSTPRARLNDAPVLRESALLGRPISAPCPRLTPGARRARHAPAVRPLNAASPSSKPPDAGKTLRAPQAPQAAPAREAPPAPAPSAPKPRGPLEEPLPPPPPPRLQWPAKRSSVAIVVDKALDTIGDVALHLRRSVSELPSSQALERLVNKPPPSPAAKMRKPVVLVLGSGWGAHSLMKVIDTDAFDVVVVSPRNHFVFTPMLPSSAVGTVEFRSLLEDVRTSNPFVHYLEATCDRLDTDSKVAYCTSAMELDGQRPVFEVPYDFAVVAVGEKPSTFGVPGVEEHAFFMKEISDTRRLRLRIQECFELASLPGCSEATKRRVLSFVVVGGGPTGVEFAGTLEDFLRQDLKRKYPQVHPLVKVTLLQSAQSILSQFSETLQRAAITSLENTGIEVRLGVRVVGVTRDAIQLKGGEELPYGCVVWSTGNAARPLVVDLASQIPAQAELNASIRTPAATKLIVDPYLRVVGARDLIALGDCTAGEGERLPATAQVAAQQGAYVARLLNWVGGAQRGRVGIGGLDQAPPARLVSEEGAPPGLLDAAAKLRPRNPAAAAAAERLSELDIMAITEGDTGATTQAPPGVEFMRRPFEFLSLGIMAYVGDDKALTQIELDQFMLRVQGALGYLLWRSVYITKQVSLRNRVLILFDWLKCKVFGRDISQF